MILNFIFAKIKIIYFNVSVVNLTTNQCHRIFGKPESARFLHISLFQGSAKKKEIVTMESEASDNPTLKVRIFLLHAS